MKRKLVTLGLSILMVVTNVLPVCAAPTPYEASLGIQNEVIDASALPNLPIATATIDEAENVVNRPGVTPVNFYDPNRQSDDYSFAAYYLDNVCFVPSARAGYKTLRIDYRINCMAEVACDWNIVENTGSVGWSYKIFKIIDLNNGTKLNQEVDEVHTTTYTQNGKSQTVYTTVNEERNHAYWTSWSCDYYRNTEIMCVDSEAAFTVEIDAPADYDFSQLCLAIEKAGEKEYTDYSGTAIDDASVDVFFDEASESPSDFYYIKLENWF